MTETTKKGGHAKKKLLKLFAYVRLMADNPGGLSDHEAAKALGINVTDIYHYRKDDLADCIEPKLNRHGNPVFGKYVLVESKEWLTFAHAIIRAMSRHNGKTE